MHPEPSADRSRPTVSPSIARRARLSRRRRAAVGQWQALGFLVVFLGLFMGMFLALGAPALIVVGGGMALGAIVLAPLALMAVSAGLGRYRLASVFGMLGVLLDAVLVLQLLVDVYDGYPLLEQIVRVLMCYAAAGTLTAAAVSTLGAARVLWGAGDGPRRLGPGAPPVEAFAADTGDHIGPAGSPGAKLPRRLNPLRYPNAHSRP